MRKELLSISLVAFMLSVPSMSFAAGNFDMQTTPAVQYAPVEDYAYEMEYPLPVNSYQPQGYQAQNYNNYYNNQLQGNVVMVPANTSFEAVPIRAPK